MTQIVNDLRPVIQGLGSKSLSVPSHTFVFHYKLLYIGSTHDSKEEDTQREMNSSRD